MPVLSVGEVDVPVALGRSSKERVPIGDQARAFDGTLRSTRRAWKWELRVVTTEMLASEAEALIDALEALEADPTVSGDWVGESFEARVGELSAQLNARMAGETQVIEFELLEV
jgi:hypothetical protein